MSRWRPIHNHRFQETTREFQRVGEHTRNMLTGRDGGAIVYGGSTTGTTDVNGDIAINYTNFPTSILTFVPTIANDLSGLFCVTNGYSETSATVRVFTHTGAVAASRGVRINWIAMGT